MSEISKQSIQTVGIPDGPNVFVKELGFEVPTFREPAGGNRPALAHHVPLEYRGPFRPRELANYDESVEYRTDAYGYLLCYARLKNSDSKCSKRAVNRINRCEAHGGRLHPLDKVKKKESYDDEDVKTLSRYQQFMAGQISTDELDDEELANGAFRAANGILYRPKNLPAQVVKEFHKAIYKRAEDGLRSGVVKAAAALVEIVDNKAVEPADRIKASSILLDRGLGKAPQQINIGVELKPHDEILDKLAAISREESRAQRGIDADFIDAETVELPQEAGNTKAEGNTEDRTISLNERAFSRDPAIMAQEIAIRPFKYEVEDNREAIKKARNRRYAAKAIGPNRFKIELQPYGPGVLRVKFTSPEDIVTPQAILKKEKRKRNFDASPFSD